MILKIQLILASNIKLSNMKLSATYCSLYRDQSVCVDQIVGNLLLR